MRCYHGTTRRRALRIRIEGFRPGKKSGRVWFAENREFARHRAEFQARNAHDEAVILPCEINLEHIRRQYGNKRIHYKHSCLAVDASLPASIVREFPVGKRQPVSPEELSEWLRQLLFASKQRAPGKRHPGIQALSDWIKEQLRPDATRIIPETDLVAKARQLLPECFEEGKPGTAAGASGGTEDIPQQQEEDRALEELFSSKARRRAHGLQRLARLQPADLLEWCHMCLADDALSVRVAALRMMRQCDLVDAARIQPFTEAADRRLRGPAITALAAHAENRHHWLRLGMTDPSVAVRREVAGLLPEMDIEEEKAAFDLARHDPNPDIRRLAEQLIQGKGFEKTWYGKQKR